MEREQKRLVKISTEQGECGIARSVALGWLRNKKRHTQTKKYNDANYVLSEKFEIN